MLLDEQPLVELARLSTWQLGAELDAPRALDVRQARAAVGDQRRLERGRGGGPTGHFDWADGGHDALTELLVGDPEDGRVEDERVGDQDVLGLLR